MVDEGAGVGEVAPRFEEYLAAREAALLRTAWLLTGDWQHAEDLVQTAMVRVWPRWAKVVAAGDPDAYVRTVLVRCYASAWRRRWRGEVPTAVLPDSAGADGDVGAADLRDALRRVLPLLPPRQRAVHRPRWPKSRTFRNRRRRGTGRGPP